MGYQTVLFDMDGTVLDTLYDLRESTNAILRELGHPERTMEEIRSYVGNGARNQIRCALPEGIGDAEIDAATTRRPTTAFCPRSKRWAPRGSIWRWCQTSPTPW